MSSNDALLRHPAVYIQSGHDVSHQMCDVLWRRALAVRPVLVEVVCEPQVTGWSGGRKHQVAALPRALQLQFQASPENELLQEIDSPQFGHEIRVVGVEHVLFYVVGLHLQKLECREALELGVLHMVKKENLVG